MFSEVRRLVIDALTADQLRVLGEAARLVAAQADPVMAAALARGCDGSECSEDLAASGNPDDPECADGSACLEAG